MLDIHAKALLLAARTEPRNAQQELARRHVNPAGSDRVRLTAPADWRS